VESNHHSARRQGYSLLSSPMLSASADRVAGRVRTGADGGHGPGCFLLHHDHHGAGTTGLEPAASRLTSERSAPLSYAPEQGVGTSAGGIRTHGLELMRLARTASPLPRSLAGRNRTCDLRRPKPAGWPAPPQPEVVLQAPRRDSGRRGSRTPKASRPTRFRDGVPRRWQSFRSGPGRRRTCNPPLKRRELCRLSYGAVCDRQGSNLRRPAFQTGALPC
jgi:hypothetical protein